MEIFKKKSLILKIVIALVVVILFNFSAPTISQAGVAEVIGGTLAEPVLDLALALGDGIMYIVQSLLFGMDESLLKVAVPGAGIVETVATIAGGILGIAAVVAVTVVTGGAALAAIIPGVVVGGTGAYVGHEIAVAALPDSFYLPIYAISPESIFQNRIGLLDVNFFSPNEYEDITTKDGQTITQESTAATLQSTISSWYLTLRNFAIVVLLIVLLYIGIRIVTSSASQDRAKYKEKLFSWVVALCLLFFMHYIMSFATTVVEAISEGINSINKPILITLSSELEKKDYKVEVVGEDGERGSVPIKEYFEDVGLISDSGAYVWPTNLMGVVRLDMQMDQNETEENQLLRRVGYTMLFLILVFYTVAFLFMYIKRLIMLAFLTMIAPLVAMTYPIDKMNDGNAQAFNMWLKEYVFNLLIQPFHLILYTMLVGSALDFATENILYAVVAMGFLFQAEKLLRKFFGFDKAGTLDTNGSTLAGMVGMAGINALRRIGGVGRKSGGKSRNGSGSENGGNTGRVRQADRGRSARDLLNARQGNTDAQPRLGSQNIPANADQDDAQTPLQRMLEADEENDNFGNSQERDVQARNAYQPTSPNYTAQQYADVLRNVGYDDDTINEIIRTDPRYANDFNQPQPSVPQPGQQQPPTIRQHIDQSVQPDPNNLNPDQPLPPPEPNEPLTLGQRLDNNFLKTSEDDTRGMGQWLDDGVSKTWNESQLKNKLVESPAANMVRKIGAGATKVKDMANKNIVEPTQKFVKGVPKPVRNTIRGAATVAGKAAAYAVPRVGKLYAKAALGATAGLVGVSAGLATSDDRNILAYGGAGLAAGLAAGTAGENIASNASRGIQDIGEKAVSTYTTAAKGADAEKARIKAKEDKAAMKDKARQEKYMNKLDVPKSEIKQVMEDYQKYRQSGITDDDIIIGAMKADRDKFGDGRANDERILLAAIANETGRDNKKIKEYGERLKELGLSEDDVKKFTNEVRNIHKMI